VRNTTLKQWVLAALFLLMPWFADAAGLGRLVVLSSLGHPLVAEIDLVSVRQDELPTLSARLASPELYKKANLQYHAALIGLRLSIEKRASGQPYIRVESTRPVTEPFIDLLIELNWAAGRITREYTALLDPPGIAAAPVASAPVTAPPVSSPLPDPIAAPAPAARVASAAPAAPAAAAGAKQYGPIQRGETLGKIAASLKPEGVSLEQMLVGLYRSNPDAFIRNNLNLVKSGRILRVPEREELTAVPQQDAVKEYRAQVADWNTYRRQLADTAGAAPDSRSAASGKITPRVDDKAAGGAAKDVVRLSKGEPPGGAASASAEQRLRMLEEEAIARDKALQEANERIAQLEKTISDQKRLIELKSPALATAQQQAKPEAQPEAKPEPVKPAEAKKDEPQVAAATDKPVADAKPEQPKPQAAAAASPKPKAATPPPPPPSLLETILGEPMYLLAGGGAIVLAGLAFLMRRRRGGAKEEDAPVVKTAPTLAADAGTAAAVGVAATSAAVAAVTPDTKPAVATSDEVDPLAEAEVYIAYGRDGPAEEILKEAIVKNPGREDVQVKLLEIYAGRKDKAAFANLAGSFNRLTGGQGENWLKVAAMGYVLDSANPLYAAGKDVPAAVAAANEAVDLDLDFDLGSSGGATTTDITLDASMAQQATGETTQVMDPGAMRAMTGEGDKTQEVPAQPLMPDFNLDVPPAGPAADAPAPAAAGDNSIDFSLELPKLDQTQETKAAGASETRDGSSGLDFKLDIPDINLDLDGGKPTGAAAGGDKDAHWYDVQTKFDLAKAYQEMGDKDGAREILREVIKEGDVQQQAEAQGLLDKLG
jgi:pilus assembly protein FimV